LPQTFGRKFNEAGQSRAFKNVCSRSSSHASVHGSIDKVTLPIDDRMQKNHYFTLWYTSVLKNSLGGRVVQHDRVHALIDGHRFHSHSSGQLDGLCE